MSHKIETIAKQFKQTVANKYKIIEIKLFGSSARGNYSTQSDIDIMVKLQKVNREIEEDIFNIAYDLELEHDCVIDVIVLGKNSNNSSPIYQNIEKEGVAI